MILDHAILGLLHWKPLTGYELKKTFDGSIRHFWTADQSHIYRVLGRLAKQGHVTFESIPQEGKPNRKVYTITEAGRAEFHRWLSAGEPRTSATRNPLLVELFFSGSLSDAQVLDKLRSEIEKSRRELATYESIAGQLLEAAATSATRGSFFSYLTVDYGIQMVRARLDWLQTVCKRIEDAEPDNPGWAERFEESAGSHTAGSGKGTQPEES